jgi:hypothetical protein
VHAPDLRTRHRSLMRDQRERATLHTAGRRHAPSGITYRQTDTDRSARSRRSSDLHPSRHLVKCVCSPALPVRVIRCCNRVEDAGGDSCEWTVVTPMVTDVGLGAVRFPGGLLDLPGPPRSRFCRRAGRNRHFRGLHDGAEGLFIKRVIQVCDAVFVTSGEQSRLFEHVRSM